MINRNLASLPTVQQGYDRLGAIPVIVQPRKSSDDRIVAFSTHPHFAAAQVEKEKNSIGLQLNVGGSFIVVAPVDPKTVDPNSEELPFLWTTVQGANNFAIKTTRMSLPKSDDEFDRVRVTIAISAGTADDFHRPAGVTDEDANETKIAQDFVVIGTDLDAHAYASSIISTGFNKLGLAIPSFPDTNSLAGALQRLYASSDYIRNDHEMTMATLADFDTAMAFWDSWGMA